MECTGMGKCLHLHVWGGGISCKWECYTGILCTMCRIRENTRMHSSRMHTGRSLTVCWSLLPGGCLLWGVSAPGGCLVRGGSAPGGGVCSWGVYPSMHWVRHPSPLWTDTRLWKYYLGPTSLRPVIKSVCGRTLFVCWGLTHKRIKVEKNAWTNTCDANQYF